MIFLLGKIGFPLISTVWVIFVLRVLLQFLFFADEGALGIVLATGISLLPSTLVLGSLVLSESLFFAGLLASAVILKSTLRWRVRLPTLLAAFIALTEVRNAAFFLMPAFVLGICWNTSVREMIRYRSLLKVGAVFLLFIGTWGSLNLVRSGSVFQPVRGSEPCAHGIAALSEFHFCTKDSLLCALDPERKQLETGKTTIEGLTSLEYSPSSPINQFRTRYGDSAENVCSEYRRIQFHLLRTEMPALFYGLSSRVFSLYGPWEVSEIGIAADAHRPPTVLEHAVDIENKFQFVYQILLFLLIVLLWRGRLQPITVFLLLGSFGYSFGIAYVEPFLLMRYGMIGKMLLLLAFVTWVSGLRRPNGNWSFHP